MNSAFNEFFNRFCLQFNSLYSSSEKVTRTSLDEIVCIFVYPKFVCGAGDAFQPATITKELDGFAGAFSATGLFALSGGLDYEATNVVAPTVSIGTMTVD